MRLVDERGKERKRLGMDLLIREGKRRVEESGKIEQEV